MSATIAEGADGEPGGLDAEESVAHMEANGTLQFVRLDWAGKVAYLALSFKDGLAMAAYAERARRAKGH